MKYLYEIGMMVWDGYTIHLSQMNEWDITEPASVDGER